MVKAWHKDRRVLMDTVRYYEESEKTPHKKVKDEHVGRYAIEKLNENDVILGRGTGISSYIGNVRFRSYVYERKEAYTCARRNEKGGIAIQLVEHVMLQDPPGRFVECLGAKGDYFVVDYERALEKTCQALREKATYALPPIEEVKKEKAESMRKGLRGLKKQEQKARAAAAAASAAQNSRPKRGRPPSAEKGSNGNTKKPKHSPSQASVSPSISSAPRIRSITSAEPGVTRRPVETPRVEVASLQQKATVPPAPALSYFMKLRLSELQSRKTLLQAASQEQWAIPEPATTAGTEPASSTEVFFILAGLGRRYNELYKPKSN